VQILEDANAAARDGLPVSSHGLEKGEQA